jgi:NADPH:quinone reductase-like Zn-dependent oxidoreductase
VKSLAILSPAAAQLAEGNPTLTHLQIHGIEVHAAFISTPSIRLRAKDPEHANKVLVRVRAFSCNYRDIGFMLALARETSSCCFPIGSDFCGDVAAVGSGVRTLAKGNRVIPNSAYHGVGPGEAQPKEGIPTNHASTEYLLVDERQLMRIPEQMPYTDGAAFTIGAQTAYAMARRLDPKPGATVLVTAARSNTSLFSIAALKRRQARVFVLASSGVFDQKLLELGVEEVFRPDLTKEALDPTEPVAQRARELGGFDHVVDPFFDIHLPRILPLLRAQASYVTCGLYDQGIASLDPSAPLLAKGYRESLGTAILRNLVIHANCLGTTEDLGLALSDYAVGTLKVPRDSTYSDFDARGFLERTYSARDRFGKVVYQY